MVWSVVYNNACSFTCFVRSCSGFGGATCASYVDLFSKYPLRLATLSKYIKTLFPNEDLPHGCIVLAPFLDSYPLLPPGGRLDRQDRKRAGWGKGVDLGVGGIIKKKNEWNMAHKQMTTRTTKPETNSLIDTNTNILDITN